MRVDELTASDHLAHQDADLAAVAGSMAPLVKWLLAIPHLIVLVVLGVAAVVSVIVARFAVVFTGRYP